MAAKLKKRALAEYLQTTTPAYVKDERFFPRKKSKKMRLFVRKSEDSVGLSIPDSGSPREISAYIVRLSAHLPYLSQEEIRDAVLRLSDLADSEAEDRVKAQIYGILAVVVRKTLSGKKLWSSLREKAEKNWIEALRNERTEVGVVSKLLSLFAALFRAHPGFISEKVYLIAIERLKDPDHDVQTKALTLLGLTAALKDRKDSVVNTCVKFTKSSDPRVRSMAFETLLNIHDTLSPLNIEFYKELEYALKDDFDRVRRSGLKLISAMASVYPDHLVTDDELRLADDAFAKICGAINDVNVHVRELAASLIGLNTQASHIFLEQTLDKKLMSNMRLKKSAHEREAKMMSAGEWSSGRNWADDAPKEELNAESINLMSFGACGAFIHGLEDEYMAVRSASVDSLTKLSIKNPKLAVLALDFLVDMFNDEIELVRIRAIESLTQIAPHISLQLHQLETILSALDDFSLVVREKLHIMLQATCIATKDGLQRVINKLLENLKKYPQDKRSLLLTYKKLGARHADLTLPLVSQLLEIHPFFDTAEPDVEDSSYLCMLVLIFNAAGSCPTLEPLLDQHTKRHYQYLVDTFPHLVPSSSSDAERTIIKEECDKLASKYSSSSQFLQQVLERVKNSNSRPINDRILVADRACKDLERLASIEPGMSSSAKFARLYIQAQSLFLKCLKSRFWINNGALGLDIIKNNIGSMFKICLQLRHRFRTSKDSNLKKKIECLKLVAMALHLLYIVRASNKSALNASEMFIKELNRVTYSYEDEDGNFKEEEIRSSSAFLYNLLNKLSEEEEDHKPGVLARVVQPLLLADPIEPLAWSSKEESISMARAVIFEPAGMNEIPLKYTAGMVLAVPVDAELYGINEEDAMNVRLSIKTPDQKILMVTPRPAEFFKKDDETYRLLTNAFMSHQVWSEAMHVEISIVLDLTGFIQNTSSPPHIPSTKRKRSYQDEEKNVIHISEPVKVYVFPKAVKRGI